MLFFLKKFINKKQLMPLGLLVLVIALAQAASMVSQDRADLTGLEDSEIQFTKVYSKEIPVKVVDEYTVVDIPETEFLEQYSLLQKGFQDVSIDIESSQPVFQTENLLAKVAPSISSHLTKNIEQTSDELTTKTNLSQISLATNYELVENSSRPEMAENCSLPTLGEAVNVKQTITLYNNSAQDQETSVILRHKLNTDKVYWNNEEYILTENPQLFQNPNRVTFYSEDEEYLSLYDYSDIPDKYEPELWAQKENDQSVLLLKLDNLFIPAHSSITIDPEYSSLKSKEEIVEQRTLTAKTYTQILPTLKKVNVAEAGLGEIHYLDKETGQYEEIDLTLEDKGSYWQTTKGSYHLKVPKYADEWFDFKDIRGDREQTISYRPICSHALGKLITDGETANKQVIYENAFGQGMDLRITAYNTHFLEEVIIREQPENELSFDFEYQTEPEDLEFKSYDMATGQEYDLKSIGSTEFKNREVLFGDNEKYTIINPMKVWDSSDKTETIKTKWFKQNNKTYFQKIISQEFLKNAVYPIYTDADTGWHSPSATGDLYNDFTNPTNAYISNNTYATRWCNPGGFFDQNWKNYGISIAAGNAIKGVEVQIEWYTSAFMSGATYNMNIYSNSRGSWRTKSITHRESEGTETLGGATDTWGITWQYSDFTDANFNLYFHSYVVNNHSKTIYIDHVKVKVYYAPVTLPTVTVQAASLIEEQNASMSGNITNTGGENCDTRGFVYATSTKTTPGNVAPASSGYSNYTIDSGSWGTGSWTTPAVTLVPGGGTKYYFRSYAHNSQGYDYSDTELFFTSKPNPPTSPTSSSVEATTAHIGWTAPVNGSVDGYYCRYKTGSYPASYTDGSAGSVSGTGSDLTGLSMGTTYYYRIWSYKTSSPNAGGCCDIPIGSTFLTKPAAPTNIQATDGAHTDKVVISWTASSGTVTGYKIYRDGGYVNSIASSPYNDTGADAPTITSGSTVASDGGSTSYVSLSLSGTSVNNGTTHTYKVRAYNATGDSTDSSTNNGYRGYGSLTYQWQRNSGDIGGATSSTHNDTGAAAGGVPPTMSTPTASTNNSSYVTVGWSAPTPPNGTTYTYRCKLNAAGCSQQYSATNTGYRGAYAVDVYEIKRSGVSIGTSFSGTSHNDTGAGAPTITPGTAAVSDGSSAAHIALSLSGQSTSNGTSYTYTIKAHNAAGWASSFSSASSAGYRIPGALNYQWYRSAGDSDGSYSVLSGAASASHNDTTAPVYTVNAPTSVTVAATSTTVLQITYSGASITDGDGRWYYCHLTATGASAQDTNHNRGYRDDTIATSNGYETFSDPNSGGSYSTSEGLDTASPFDDTGLGVNIRKYYKVRAKSTAGTWSEKSTDYDGKYTWANAPAVPGLSNATVKSVDVNNDPNANPGSTEFTLYFEAGTVCDGSGGWYIDTYGYASSVAFWQNDATWGTKTVQNLDENTGYSFCSKARNGDNTETAWSSDSDNTTTDAVPAISAALAQPSPQTVGSKTTFVVEWSAQASFGETVNVHICKTNDLTGAGNTCASPWCEDLSYTDAKLQTCQYTTLSGDIGSNDFWAFVCDEEVTCTSGTMGTFSVNDTSVRLKGGIRLKGNIRLK